MNKEETIKCMEIMQAFVNGKTIQFTFGLNPFGTTTIPCWQWGFTKYRYLDEPNPNNDADSIKETKKYLKIMQAFVDGKQIQYRHISNEEWRSTDTPAWSFVTYKYRVEEIEMTDEEIFKGLKKCADEIVMRDIAKASLVDSGERTNVGNGGAVRESPEEKGRMDLVPCDFIVNYLGYEKDIDSNYALIANGIEEFKKFGDRSLLVSTISLFANVNNMNIMGMLVNLSKHFQAGAIKYSENNWQKGMPVKYYISSAERHLVKHMLEFDDENHAMAFIWNLCAAWWTCKHKPEYNDYAKGETK